ncbi:sigma 54-interacting transcriptional regulator [Defluviimonas sp. D31]|uniref:sigma 54-interacting transcriptional regulator n=1 Tax=Defluviimonas sp. D31 TaxID=3083253 RepID=UPI00296F6042|nr:sigma 54-interacting transcriptional regulator [Defluviimonas sp. D31]MDW4551637.1 sigma 54-interacting transcriptional regulator [Defluviimonas sp. D31]
MTDGKFLQALLGQGDDGLLLVDEDGRIRQANPAAARLLDGDAVPGNAIRDLFDGSPELMQAVSAGRRADLALRWAGGRNLMVSIRPGGEAENLVLIQVTDLDSFDYRRNAAAGEVGPAQPGFLSTNRTRPDFGVQRRLSPALNRLLSRGERAMRQNARIVITGESGVGKSEIARFLHGTVADGRDPFVICNCATSNASDLSQTLFGADGKPGLIDVAAGGTLFLDEIAEIPLSLQAQLLSFIEDGRQIWQSPTPQPAKPFRVISATNADLLSLVRNGRFRADLYYRLAVIELGVAPLRRMPELIPHLTDRFLQTVNQRRVTPVVLPQRLRGALSDYSFPGNIRELLNIVHKATIFTEDADDMDELIAELIVPHPGPDSDDLPHAATLDLRTEVRRFERALIDKAIRIHGSKRKAAKVLGVDIGTIVRKTA